MTTDNATELTYTITEFDQQHLVILVDFPNDGTKANIQLTSIPETLDELDALVKPFGTHQEVVAAVTAAAPASLSFLESQVGVSNTTTRFSQTDFAATVAASAAATAETQATAAALPTNEIVIGPVASASQAATNEANNKAADLAYIKELIAQAVAGLTPAQVVAATSTTGS
jgi:hypothetical protein